MVFKETKLRGAERLSSLKRRIMQSVDVYHPELVALEGYSYESTNRLADLSEIGGVLKLELYEAKIPFIVVPPKSLKKFVTGKGDASKDRMMISVLQRYAYRTDNDNIADAVGLAKFAEVYLTGFSEYRSELEVMRNFKAVKPKKKKRYKKSKISI